MRKKSQPIQPKLRLRDRRRKMLQIKIAAGVLLLLLVVGGLFFVVRIPELTISKVEVKGTVVANPELVQKIADDALSGSYAYLVPKRNTLFLPARDIEQTISHSFPIVKSAKVTHTSLTSVSILVTERSPSALWCTATDEPSTCYFMDEDGFIYMVAGESDAYVRYSGIVASNPVGQVFLEGRFGALSAFVAETGKTLGRVPKAVSVDSNQDVSLSFIGGGELKFVLSENTTGVLENIASVFASQKLKGKTDFEYADFRFGNKVYVKFKD